MNATASPQQLVAFQQLRAGPLVLFCQYRFADGVQADACTRALAEAARRYGGTLRWSGAEEDLLCGRIALYQRAASVHFTLRDGARGFVESGGFRTALSRATALQVTVLSAQPKIVTAISFLLSRLAPSWPFDNAVAEGEEPGIGTSVMPTAETIARIRSHPDQHSPVTMINWLKFRDRANYLHGEAAASGREAYLAYGRVAMTTTHSLGAKLLQASRYRMVLVGNDGDPGLGLWDEFALMQYPGRVTFGHMAQLRRYRAALHHRAAGLAEYGQGLTLARPAPEFTWKR
jgi:hypothetical protein